MRYRARHASCIASILVASLLSGAARASDDATPLCGVLREVLPRVDGYLPEGARAEFVMTLAEAFDYDGERLSAVKAEIDAATSAACPKERDRLLEILKTPLLRDAL